MKKYLTALGFCVVVAGGLVACGGRAGTDGDSATGSNVGSGTDQTSSSADVPTTPLLARSIKGPHEDGLVLTDGVNDFVIPAGQQEFQFPVPEGTSRTLSIKSQPSNASETCSVTGTSIADAVITCVQKPRFTYVAVPSTGEIRQFTADASTGALTFVRSVPWGDPGANDDDDVVTFLTHPFKGLLYVQSKQLGSTTIYSIDSSTGFLTQSASAITSDDRNLVFLPDGKSAYSLDYTNDLIKHYGVDQTTGALALAEQKDVFTDQVRGTSMAVDPDGKWIYIVNIYGMFSFPINADGTLGAVVETPALPNSLGFALDIVNKLVYVHQHVGEDTVRYPFAIQANGTYVKQPQVSVLYKRQHAVEPLGRFLFDYAGTMFGAIEASNITDKATGTLSLTGFQQATPYASNIFFSPDGKYVTVTSTDVANPSKQFKIGDDGSLTESSGLPPQMTGVPAKAITYY